MPKMGCRQGSTRVQETWKRGEVELAVGVVEGEEPYQFEAVGALARDVDGRIYVGDSGAMDVRVFDPDGAYVYRIGGRGEGPGELAGPEICGLAFDPEERLWINQRISYEVFAVGDEGAQYVNSVSVPGVPSSRCGNPMFAGPTGLTLAHYQVLPPGMRAIEEHLHLSADGNVVSNVAFPDAHLAAWGEWEWPVLIWRHPRRGSVELEIEPPFAARTAVAHAPAGGLAHVFTAQYDIHIHHPDGELRARIRKKMLGPVVTDDEARRERERLSEQEALSRGMDADFPDYRTPTRKPVIRHIWYDEDGRLWVLRSPAEADTMSVANVYDGDGRHLYNAAWPRGVSISRGGVSGVIALGVRRMPFDVPQVVRLRFLEVVGRPAGT